MPCKLKEHPVLTEAEDIKIICQPLEHLNISYFAHVRIDSEGKFSALSNNPEFHEHYIKNQYYNADIHMANQKETGKYILWDAISCEGESQKMNEEAEAFGFRHTFTIVEKIRKNTEYYHFSTHLSNSAINQEYLQILNSSSCLFCLFMKKSIRLKCSLVPTISNIPLKRIDWILW